MMIAAEMGEQGAEVGVLSGSANGTEFVSGIHLVGSVMCTADEGFIWRLSTPRIDNVLDNLLQKTDVEGVCIGFAGVAFIADYIFGQAHGLRFGKARTQAMITIKTNRILSKLGCSDLSVTLVKMLYEHSKFARQRIAITDRPESLTQT